MDARVMVVMTPDARPEDVTAICLRIQQAGAHAHVISGSERQAIGMVGGDREALLRLSLDAYPGVERIVAIVEPYKLVARQMGQGRTSPVRVGDAVIGGGDFTLIAGPCTIENRTQALDATLASKAAGATILRGGAFKPRTSPYSFQGLGPQAVPILAEVKEATGLPLVSEVMEGRHVAILDEVVDMFQVGARNMQNFDLLRELGRAGKPVLLKRGPSSTIEEWLLAAEYMATEGNDQIVLCERGIRTFETATRSTLDLSSVAVAHRLSRLPVIVDPSHAAGRRDLVLSLALAAVAVGADGVIVETHPAPEDALCDGAHAIISSEMPEFGRSVLALAGHCQRGSAVR